MNSFKTWIEAQLNPLMYDRSTPKGNQEYLDDLLNLRRISQRKEVSRKPTEENITVTCWRGTSKEDFKASMVSQTANEFVINSAQSMEGIFWFTHQLQRGLISSPEEYAQSYNKGVLITYPLPVKKVYDLVTYSDGTIHKDLPQGHQPMDTTGKNQVLAMNGVIYHLPQNWFFTWQVEKFIGFEGDLRINRSMVQIS